MSENKKQNSKVLFLVPSPNSKGGISNYYSVIKDSISFPYDYFYRGVRRQHSTLNRFFSIFVFALDYFAFFFKIRYGNYSIVIINTSFGKTGFWRDYLFIKIIKWCNLKYIVFFRGIDDKILNSYILKKRFVQFKKSFLLADSIIVLSKNLKNKLIALGYTNEINIETTVVNTSDILKVTRKSIEEKQNSENIKILFLSRIERDKGIYELIEAFRMIRNFYFNTSLHICGTGSEYNIIKKIILPDEKIYLKGFVINEEKINEYTSANIFVLPSYHEGLPNSIVEAMAFGLPIITTPVGGIPDIFVDKVNGLLLKNIDNESIVASIKEMIINKEFRIKTGLKNFQIAKDRFQKEKVVERLNKIILNI